MFLEAFIAVKVVQVGFASWYFSGRASAEKKNEEKAVLGRDDMLVEHGVVFARRELLAVDAEYADIVLDLESEEAGGTPYATSTGDGNFELHLPLRAQPPPGKAFIPQQEGGGGGITLHVIVFYSGTPKSYGDTPQGLALDTLPALVDKQQQWACDEHGCA